MENIKGLSAFVPSLRISAGELRSVQQDRKKLDALRAQADLLARTLDEREDHIIRRMESGASVEGEAIVLTRRRQNISWLTIVKRELGAEAIVQAKNDWPVTFYKELQIG